MSCGYAAVNNTFHGKCTMKKSDENSQLLYVSVWKCMNNVSALLLWSGLLKY